MTDLIFSLGNMTAMVGWSLLIVLPRWRGVAQKAATIGLPLLLSLAYTALVAAWWNRSAGGFGTLKDVHTLFQTPAVLLAGWLHYLAFDLFVGAWVARESARDGIPHGVVVPILILTFLFGPIGYLVSWIVRAVWRITRIKEEEGRERGVFGRVFTGFAAREPRLAATAFACMAAAIPTLIAALIDERTLNGANVWLKPLKFDVSVGIYLGTLAFFLPNTSEVFRKSALGRFVVWGSIITSVLELVYISWRASRGEASHFNTGTPLAAALYALMGIGALLLAAAAPVLAWGIMRSDARPLPPAYRLGIILGLLATFVLGTLGGAVMSSGTGHFVGSAAPGDPTLPVVGWSRTVGDLRVPHFLGLHAQQVIPLVGALAAMWLGRLARPMVVGVTILYSLVTIGLFIQAMAGQPFLSW